jgi:hypothetical protein
VVTSVVNRYYDPTTDQFISIDPDVADTDQPYVFTNDNPLNSEDPLGLKKCTGPGAPTEAQLIGCEDYTETGSTGDGDPTNSGTAQWDNLVTTFTSLFGMLDPFDAVPSADTDALDATPQGRVYTAHYLNETGPLRRLPGSVVDETIDHASQVEKLDDRTIYYDAKNNVTVVRSDTTGKIMSARKGKP